MRSIRVSLLACLVAVSVVAMAQDPIPISEVRKNDGMGIPLLLDQVVTVQGIVTAPSGVFHTSRTDVYIQDSTGGVNLFQFQPIATYNLGDEVKVTGTVLVYRGLTEIEPISVELIAAGRPLPQPKVITCNEMYYGYDFDTNVEENEARLVRLNNVTWNSTSLALTDSTGTSMMFIVGSTGIPYPTGEFNVVGVVKQFDENLGVEGPYYLGYEVLPRYISDITYGSGPQFTTYPVQTDVAVGGATIEWTTDVACETVLEYGTTPDFELPPIRLGNSTTDHVAVLTGLPSATLYHCRAVAGSGDEAVESPAITVITPATGSSGEVEVFFSQSVDTSYSTGVAAVQTDIGARMVERIEAADHSIDFCFNILTLEEVANALVAAKNRGVQVRVIYEVFDPAVNILTAGGIEVRTDPDAEHENMHNKFAVFDAGDADESDDFVWTGSWNATYSGTHFNAENVVVVQDAALATAYAIEFEEMWGGAYSNSTADNTPHLFLIGGKRVEQYMGPSENLRGKTVDAIGTAEDDLLFAIYTFTESAITTAFTNRIGAGVAVRGVVDAVAADYEYSQHQPLITAGADIVLDDVEGDAAEDQILHHKYIISDPFSPASDPILVTGSFNWTNTAAVYKNENIVVFHDPTIANLYFQEWMARYHEGGGTWEPAVAPVASFTFTPESPAPGETVTFTDTSSGAPTSWAWTFGDGATSSAQSPTHAFAAAGSYTVTLTASNANGSSTVSHTLLVGEAPELGETYLVGAAGNAAGTGSQWATDVEVNNPTASTLSYQFLWLPRDTDNSDPTRSEVFTLAPGASARYENVVGEVFGVSAFGALAVAADSDQAIVMSRTYNVSAMGTFGQSIPGIHTADLIQAGERMRIVFMTESQSGAPSSGYRANLGFQNGTSAALTVNYELHSSDGALLGDGTVNLQPWGNTQLNRVLQAFAPVDGYVDVWTEAAGGAFVAYGSVVDNGTADPTTIMPTPAVDGSLQAALDQLYYVGAAGNAAGTGSQWATDVEVNNPTTATLSYQFLWLPRGADNSDPTRSDVFTLAPGASARYENVVGEVFGVSAFGALAVASDSGQAIVMSRTYNVSAAGTFGQSIEGLHASRLVPADDRVRIVFMTESQSGSPSTGYRANLGFQNGTNAALVVNYALYSSSGDALGDGTVELQPWGNTQINRVLQGSAPVDGYVDVWTETAGGALVAYGSVVDNGTADPTTIMPE